MLSMLSQPLPVLVSPGNKENPPILDHVQRPAESPTHALDPSATSENTSNQKSPVFVTPKLILRGVEESSNAYPPLKSVARHLLSGFAPFRVFPFGCSCSLRTSFPLRLLSCTLGLVLMTSASTVSSASSVLALLSIGLVVNVSPYLISLSLILSYLISFLYLIVSLFIVWTMVAPATPSHSILVLSFVPNTGKHGPCAGLCADRLGI
jgi:hypothetical protein